MTGDLGEVVKPYLKAGYSAVYYGLRASGFDDMDDPTTVYAAGVAAITSEEPEDLHNQVLHERIVTAWKMYHPEMWRNLQRLGIGKAFAVVQQNRMWRETDLLEAGGMPPNETRKIAEREHLMLAPDA